MTAETPGRRERTARSAKHAVRNAQIKRLYATGKLTYKEIGDMFGLSGLRVNEIVHDPRATMFPPPPKRQFDAPAANEDFAKRAAEMKALYGDGNNGWTLQKIGEKFGVTRERVRQIINNPNSEKVRPKKPTKIATGTPGRQRYQTHEVEGARHGTPQGYFSDGCRCDRCFNAYRKDYELRKALKNVARETATQMAEDHDGRGHIEYTSTEVAYDELTAQVDCPRCEEERLRENHVRGEHVSRPAARCPICRREAEEQAEAETEKAAV